MHDNVERNVLALATEQHALLARWQALQLGMSTKTIQTKVSSGAWRRHLRGLYEVSGSSPTGERRVMEAVLGAGRDAVASHVAAGRLHELLTAHPSIIDVTFRRRDILRRARDDGSIGPAFFGHPTRPE